MKPKSFKFAPQKLPSWIPKASKIPPKRPLGGALGDLGGAFGVIWAPRQPQEPKKSPTDPQGTPLDPQVGAPNRQKSVLRGSKR